MKKLPMVLRKNGFDYKQIKREENKAIYEQSKDGFVLAYEVFKVKIAKESVIAGNVIEEHEKFPGDNAFGATAWSCRTLEGAEGRYLQLR